MFKLTDFRVAVLATDGFEESELTEPAKALRDAGAQVTIFSLQPGQIQGVRHDLDKTVKVKVDCAIRDVSAEEFDAVHLPGGTVNADSMRVVPEVQAFLREMQDAGKPITAICHAPWELVSAGLVRGRTLTSYHPVQDDIRNAGGAWENREVVEDGNWVTSRQPDDLPAFNRAMIDLFARSRRAVPYTGQPYGLKRRTDENLEDSVSTKRIIMFKSSDLGVAVLAFLYVALMVLFYLLPVGGR